MQRAGFLKARGQKGNDVRRGRDRRPWKAGPRRRSRSSPIEQKAPSRPAKRAVQLTLPFSMASKSGALSIPTVSEPDQSND